jgi:creatinine amidohydrolase
LTGLDALTFPEAAAGGVLAVPLGATEQHGPHLPLTTDTEIAVALAAGLARARDDVVVAPALPYGSSGEHAGFAGTVSIGQEAVELVVVELCRSASDSFATIVLVSAHGGNAEPVARAARTLGAEGRDVRVWSPRWGAGEHGGHAETSIMLALAPDRVRLDLAEPGDTRPLAELLPGLRAGGVATVSSNGILGDPTAATADEGLRLLAAATDDLVSFLA